MFNSWEIAAWSINYTCEEIVIFKTGGDDQTIMLITVG